MISSLALTAALQLGSALPPIYEPEVSDETDAIEALGATGDDSAYELLGEVHSFGVMGVERDRQKACEYFELIGDRRPDGLHNRATCYFDGEGREQDLSKARALYLKAAENGWLQAWCAYGNMLIRGRVDRPTWPKASDCASAPPRRGIGMPRPTMAATC